MAFVEMIFEQAVLPFLLEPSKHDRDFLPAASLVCKNDIALGRQPDAQCHVKTLAPCIHDGQCRIVRNQRLA